MHYYRHTDPYFSDDHPAVLDEITTKDMLNIIDPFDLPHRDYAPLVKYVNFVAVKRDIMKFIVPSRKKLVATPPLNAWFSYVQFVEWDAQVRDTGLSAPEAARLLYWSGNIRVHCGCPSFLYWGYQYILTQLDAAMRPEERFPHIRNPLLRGILCKHLRRTIKTLGFHLGDMATAIKRQRQHY
jgi:hypothetical protein